jgi:hypothetical protein
MIKQSELIGKKYGFSMLFETTNWFGSNVKRIHPIMHSENVNLFYIIKTDPGFFTRKRSWKKRKRSYLKQ